MKATVLLVDDEPIVREELGGLLEDEGYAVITAKDGEEGLEVFIRQQPDMVITDAKMPRREGISLAREILARNPATPITMITGHGSEAMSIEALRLGITDFLKKPVQLADLVAALERMEGARGLAAGRALGSSSLPPTAQLVRVTMRYEVGNSLEEIPQFVAVIIASVGAGLDSRKRDGLHLALREMVINAVEHGNLGVSFEEKTEANEHGTLASLLELRRADPTLASRRVRVKAERTATEITIVVEDEGQGFDWRTMPDPTDAANLLRTHGRGVLLASLSVDELKFNDRGNRVALVARLGGG